MTSNQHSAGILLYRRGGTDIEVLIAHPGGPFWASHDAGAWTIPKGIVEVGESTLEAAKREFVEEIGFLPTGTLRSLGTVIQRSGKTVHAWAVEGDFVADDLDSHMLEMEWPRSSGRIVRFPEIDRVCWAKPAMAKEKLNRAQADLVDRLLDVIDAGS